jgi:hypothetical protein
VTDCKVAMSKLTLIFYKLQQLNLGLQVCAYAKRDVDKNQGMFTMFQGPKLRFSPHALLVPGSFKIACSFPSYSAPRRQHLSATYSASMAGSFETCEFYERPCGCRCTRYVQHAGMDPARRAEPLAAGPATNRE